MKSKLIVLLACIFFVGCASKKPTAVGNVELPPQEIVTRYKLVGEWGMTLPTENGGTRKEHAVLNSDGTFVFRFTHFNPKNEIETEYSQSGIWGLVNNIHFTVVLGETENWDLREVYGSNPNNYAAYEVLELTKNVFRYRDLVFNTEYKLEKIK